MIVVFSGPTLRHDVIKQNLDCICLPPVKHRDIFTALELKPSAIGIIDGYFEGAPSVWHKEILYALGQGVHVFGCSSMGALRAAELHQFGMKGVGQIFEWYRDGIIEDDDEVAVLHGPAETDYIVASEPMVSIRATLELAHLENVIDESTKNSFLAFAKSRFYKQRSWKNLLNSFSSVCGDTTLSSEAVNWISANRVDLKKQDAILMLQKLRKFQAKGSEKFRANYHFEWTNVWDVAFNGFRGNGFNPSSLCDQEKRVIEQLKLDCELYVQFRDRALLKWICNSSVETNSSDIVNQVEFAIQRFCLDNQLSSEKRMTEYMVESRWDDAQFVKLMEEVSQVELVRKAAGSLDVEIIEQLKLHGRYFEFLKLANEKRQALHSIEAGADDLDLSEDVVLRWYFEKKLKTQVPESLDLHLSKIDLPDPASFHRIIEEDYMVSNHSSQTACKV